MLKPAPATGTAIAAFTNLELPVTSPLPASQRIATLGIVRGFALLGILRSTDANRRRA